jgi:hypothetical protein
MIGSWEKKLSPDGEQADLPVFDPGRSAPPLARIFRSFRHRCGHFLASGLRDGDGNWICGLVAALPRAK